MRGKLIVIESGTDASGKKTQTKLLYERLIKENNKVKQITFPDYESESSALVKMYLRGEFGKDPDRINPYAASTFFAVDRYASYVQKWKKYLDEGYTIISDRYTTSNMIHQGSKIADKAERSEYLEWLIEFEYNKIKLPKPDKVMFLDVPVEISVELKNKRIEQIEGDIHENSIAHLTKSYRNSLEIAQDYNWEIIECTADDKMKPVEEINDIIYNRL